MSKISRQINISYGHKHAKAWHTNVAVCVLYLLLASRTHDDHVLDKGLQNSYLIRYST